MVYWKFRKFKNCLNSGLFFLYKSVNDNEQKGRNIINAIPIDRIVIESDAPFTVGLNSSYNLSFISDIIGYLSINKKIDEKSLYVQIKENFILRFVDGII